MASNTNFKMSLQAQFDDLCRYTAVLTPGCTKEFKTLAQEQKKLCLRIKDLVNENRHLLQRVNDLETERLGFETRLKHARNLLITGDEKYRKLEKEKISLERQIVLIKELLADENGIDNQTKEKLVQLSTAYSQQNDFVSRLTTIEESGSLLSSSDCDETVESIENHGHHKRNKTCPENGKVSVQEKEWKDDRNYLSTENVFTFEEVVIPNKNITYRSSSEPTAASPEMPAPRQIIRSDSENLRENSVNSRRSFVRSRPSLPLSRYSTDGKLSKNHAFVPKTYIRSEKCHPCGKMIKFCKQGLKCSDCRISCHMECKEQCVIPCIPVNINSTKGSESTIADYTTSVSPMIPSIIVHCVNEIESRGFQDIGLYRVPGSEREIKEIKDKFLKGKSVPLLNEVDVHAVCGTIKEFLRSLKESLITKSSWMSFVDITDHGEESVQLKFLYDLVCHLPQPNRETLAFLILHLQRVAAAPMCKMPIWNLAKVFGPTIVGYSSDEDVNLLLENKQQNKVMEMLLKIPSELWEKVLNTEPNIYNTKLRTPESLPVPVASRLGPIYSSQRLETLLPDQKSNFSPRADGRKRKYFSSPKLKS